MTKEEVLALPLSELTLTSHALGRLLRSHIRALYPDSGKRWREYRDQLSETTTVSQIITALDCEKVEWQRNGWNKEDGSAHKQFKSELVKQGLTRLDWIELTQASMTIELMCGLSKEEWLTKPVSLLGTIPERFIESIDFRTENGCGRDMTVYQLLQGPAEKYFYWRISELQIARTRNLLRQLGFTYEDGWFMQLGSKRKLQTSWMEQHSISEQEAEMVFTIARKEGWIPNPID